MSQPDIASPTAEKYLRLHLCQGVGAIRSACLLRELGGIDAVLNAGSGSLSSVRGIGRQVADAIARGRDRANVDDELERAARHDVRILCLEDDNYPVALKHINDPPACLYLRGTLKPEDAVALAVVGSRRCTRYGAEQAERFAALLAQAGMTIVSGMARGIDSYAHGGALAANGRTLAVMGCGLSHVYPPESTELAERIRANGAILSELPMDTAPDAGNFPPRNRIIVGLSLGVLVVEAARRSGALISARLAVEYNREVFTVPGQIDRPHSAGCHELIKTGGAKLVTDLTDILEDLGETGAALLANRSGEEEARPAPPAVKLDDLEARIARVLAGEPVSIDIICDEAGLPPARVAAALTGLQLKGVVRRVGGDLYERTRV
ncbi:MAG: DNA-processing protein DprA [Phycisphaerae bacterium]